LPLPSKTLTPRRTAGAASFFATLLLILVAAIGLLEAFLGLFILRAGVLGLDLQTSLSKFIYSATVDMVWQFIAGASVFVVAFQITWANLGDSATPPQLRRINRFRIGAIALGAVSINAWLLFVTVYRGNGPGQVVVSALVAGVLYFAIDAATVVTRVDRRNALEMAQRKAGRIYIVDSLAVERNQVTRSRDKEPKDPVRVLIGCIFSLVIWWILIVLLGLSVLIISDHGAIAEAILAYLPQSAPLLLVLASELSLFCFASLELLRVARRGNAAKLWCLIGAGAVLLLFAGLLGAMFVSFLNVVGSVGSTAIMIATLAIAAGLPLTAAVFPSVGSKRWWTPRGSIRIGRTALARLGLEYRQRQLTYLWEIFGEADRVPVTTDLPAQENKIVISINISLPIRNNHATWKASSARQGNHPMPAGRKSRRRL
jgi:hypothetical protein